MPPGTKCDLLVPLMTWVSSTVYPEKIGPLMLPRSSVSKAHIANVLLAMSMIPLRVSFALAEASHQAIVTSVKTSLTHPRWSSSVAHRSTAFQCLEVLPFIAVEISWVWCILLMLPPSPMSFGEALVKADISGLLLTNSLKLWV